MKNLLLILILYNIAFAYEIIPKLGFGVFVDGYKETSKIIYNQNNYSEQNVINDFGIFKSTVGIDILFNNPKVYFLNNMYLKYDNEKISFSPTVIEFYSGLNYLITNKISLNFEHLCIHPINFLDNSHINKYGGYKLLIEIRYNY